MSWTDDRVATLKKLWNDGLSASLIATKIGEVTRNAVIGKAHRLGLAGRTTGSRKRSPAHAASLFRAPAHPRKTRTVSRIRGPSRPPIRAAPKGPVLLPELGLPPDEFVTVRTLTARSCRWPIGDPKADGFHFCGRAKPAGGPYCDHHAGIAYGSRR